MNEGLQEYAHRLRVMGQLSSAEYAELIRFRDGELLQLLCSYTEQIRKSRPDSSIMWVGTIDLIIAACAEITGLLSVTG